MRALIQSAFGDPSVLRIEDRAIPEVGPSDVRIRVHAVSLNFGDKATLLGTPRLFRPMFGSPKNRVMGHDAAGVVDAVGSEVTGFAPGDRVFGELVGSCAEFALAAGGVLVKLPDEVALEDAATLPIAGITALQGLRDCAAVKEGQKVLNNGASGSVGTMAVQIAKSLGAHVTAVCSTSKVEQARTIGADDTIDYTKAPYFEGGPRFDVVFDLVGNHSLVQRRSALNPGGTYVATFGQGGGDWVGPLARIFWVALMSLFSKQLKVLTVAATEPDLHELAGLVRDGALKPAIQQVYPLEDAAEAFRVLLDGHARGKLVIRLAE